MISKLNDKRRKQTMKFIKQTWGIIWRIPVRFIQQIWSLEVPDYEFGGNHHLLSNLKHIIWGILWGIPRGIFIGVVIGADIDLFFSLTR